MPPKTVPGVTPDRVKSVPRLFGKNGMFGPWFAAIAGTIMLYFRVLHFETPLSAYFSAPIKAAPIFLLWAFTREMKKWDVYARYARSVSTGLLCSAAGDILLDFEGETGHEAFFVGGLLSFLVGHIFYIVAFTTGMQLADLKPAAAIPILLYALGLFSYLYSHLPTVLVGPVLIYALVIGGMAITAVSRPVSAELWRDATVRFSWLSGAFGALTFVASDSVLAVNKFAFKVPAGKDIVMATYYIGQLGIALSVWGAREVKREPKAAKPAAEEGSATGNAPKSKKKKATKKTD